MFTARLIKVPGTASALAEAVPPSVQRYPKRVASLDRARGNAEIAECAIGRILQIIVIHLPDGVSVMKNAILYEMSERVGVFW